ncbi:MAG: gliding motility-associated C-terminal domain-containing protein [Saprospiraceae bacterium]|nr:gliding motility-associated C-terminal domain-containing protein [Saprospiraceae bacterium]
MEGFTSVGDLNNDGKLEIIVSPRTTIPCINLEKKAIFYVYNFLGNQVKLLDYGSITLPYCDNYSGSPVLVSDLQNNGLTSITFILKDSIHNYYLSSNKLIKNWSYYLGYYNLHPNFIYDFDFNNDGMNEIIYNTYNYVHVLSIENCLPAKKYSIPCNLADDYKPIIGKLGDETGICLPCFDELIQVTINSWYNSIKFNVFGSPDSLPAWTPSRGVWNQNNYHVININDDGKVPQFMPNQATYQDGRYNNFWQQATTLDSLGRYKSPAASIFGEIICINYDEDTDRYHLLFSIHNKNDASLAANSPMAVSFYDQNGIKIGTYQTISTLRPGQSHLGLEYTFTATQLTKITMIVNTDVSFITSLEETDYQIEECDYSDNLSQSIEIPTLFVNQVSICEVENYDFYGQSIGKEGIYHYSLQNTKGCDSLVERLDLKISTTKSVSLTATACDTYTWNGQTYTTDGSYIYDTQSVNGCDSITTLNLSVYRSDQLNLSQQSCDDYVWNGQTYNQSGIYTYRAQNIHGCDSIVTLDLTVFPSIDISMTHAACDTFIWNGQPYTESGIYNFQSQTQHGCDSTVTLDLTISDVLHTELPVTACDSYTWNGQTYDTAGDDTFTGISMSGCDSIATLHLSVLSSTFSNETQTACTSFTWNNQTYNQSGTYLFQTKNAQGCDSTATLYLTLHQPTTSEQWVTACDSYYWDNDPFVHNTSGTYTQTIRNKNGCDSLMTLHLLISKSTSDTLDVSACEVYYINGSIPIFNDVKFILEAKNSYGCDSNTVYNITIHQPKASTTTENVCDSLNFFGNTLDSTGIYTHTLSDQFGCDSTITLRLNILSSTLTDHIANCDSYTWPQTGLTYDTSGIFSRRFTNAVGCDSTYTLDLRILPSYQIEDTVAECGAYLWPIDGSNYDHTGRYSKRFITRDGCDSTYTLVLDIRPQHLFVDTVITNQDYLWDVNNTTYTQSGIYTQKFLTSFDCDSVHILDLRINKSTDIFFPNIISPDGINGFFTGYSHNTTMTIASLSVYDRWGNLLFLKENFPTNEPLLGWNGKFQGRDVVPGVFTWLAVIRLPDGYTSTLSGDVTVVR